MTVLEANKKKKSEELRAEEYKTLWENRRAWAIGHIFPIIKAFLNDAMLKENFGKLCLYAGDMPSDGSGECVRLGSSSYGPHYGMGFLPIPLCARTVLINPNVADNYQFMVGVIGDAKGDSWVRKYRPNTKPFSLAFAATQKFMPNGHDGFTPENIKCVGLPEKNEDAAAWVRAQIKRHWDYWLEHNTKVPVRTNLENEHYNKQMHFVFPEEL
jgi:hypothetical protein